MNIDKMDTIIMSNADMDRLFEWRDNHKDYVRNFKPVLKEGVIKVIEKGELIHMEVFHDIGIGVKYTVYANDDIVHQMIWGKENGIGEVLKTKLNFDEDQQFEYNQSVISLHASLMAYMEYYSDRKEYVASKNVRIPKRNKSGKGSKKSKRVVNIKRKVYKVNIDSSAVERDKRRYDRKTEGWMVRGFWRHYKSGKKVWIDSYPKGNKRKIEPKTYKLGD